MLNIKLCFIGYSLCHTEAPESCIARRMPLFTLGEYALLVREVSKWRDCWRSSAISLINREVGGHTRLCPTVERLELYK